MHAAAIRDLSPQPPKVQPVTRRVYGLDLGKLADFSALTALHFTWPPVTEPAPPPPDPFTATARQQLAYLAQQKALEARRQAPPTRPTLEVPALKRWPLGTSYHAIADWLVRFLEAEEARRYHGPPPILAVDETGVGTATVEILLNKFRQSRVQGALIGITITGGKAVSTPGGGRWRVAKMELAGVLVSGFEGQRFDIASFPERELLIKEAQEFSLKVTPAGNETVEALREGAHDDMVLSLALAAWVATRWPGWKPWPPKALPSGWRV